MIPSANVHRLQPRPRPRTYDSREDLIEELRILIFKDGRTYKAIAEATGVGSSTIRSVACGNTRWPKYSTLFPLLSVLKVRLTLVNESNT